MQQQQPDHIVPRRYALFALILSSTLVLITLVLLPFGLASIAASYKNESSVTVYDLKTGERITSDTQKRAEVEGSYLDVGISSIQETGLKINMFVSGHRNCSEICPEFTISFYSVPQERDAVNGLPPSASMTVPGTSGPFSQTFTLPVSGKPGWYPFDVYRITLALTVTVKDANGNMILVPGPLVEHVKYSITLQSRMASINLDSLTPSDPAVLTAESYPYDLLYGFVLTFSRESYLKVLTVVLILLISVSSLFSIFLRGARDSLLGISALVLSIWGVRSVLVKGDLPDVTLVDVCLAATMVLFLLILWIRVTVHFWRVMRHESTEDL